MACEHIIGEWLRYDDTRIVTLENLKECIRHRNKFVPMFYKKELTLRDYADKRKSLNFIHFNFCPMCGEKIDWKKIRESADAEMELGNTGV